MGEEWARPILWTRINESPFHKQTGAYPTSLLPGMKYWGKDASGWNMAWNFCQYALYLRQLEGACKRKESAHSASDLTYFPLESMSPRKNTACGFRRRVTCQLLFKFASYRNCSSDLTQPSPHTAGCRTCGSDMSSTCVGFARCHSAWVHADSGWYTVWETQKLTVSGHLHDDSEKK